MFATMDIPTVEETGQKGRKKEKEFFVGGGRGRKEINARISYPTTYTFQFHSGIETIHILDKNTPHAYSWQTSIMLRIH